MSPTGLQQLNQVFIGAQAFILPITSGLSKKKRGKKKVSQSFPRRSLTAWFTSYCVLYKMMSEAPSLISIHLRADYDPPQGLERLVSTSPAFFLQLTPTIKSNHQHLLGRSLSTHLGFHPLQLPFKEQAGPLNHVTLISSGACIQDYSNKRSGTGALSTAIHTSLVQRKHLPSSSWN